MELATVKTEFCPRNHRMFMIKGGNIDIKCMKRRQRDSSVAILKGNEKQEQPKQGGQSTTTTTVKRSSRFRSVSRHRWTGRYEAHLWGKGTWNPTQKKKGKQVYLGAYADVEAAARAYDLAALKYWGTSTFTNFPVSNYENEIEIMKNMTKEEYIASLRSGFSTGVSKHRGVASVGTITMGRWEARIGRVFGNKDIYLVTYSTQEEAARAYDIAAIEYRGLNAVTNFDLSTYLRWLRPETLNTTSQAQQQNPEFRNLMANPNLTQTREITEVPNFNHNNPKEQDIPQYSTPLCQTSNAKSSSSPTALGLLLKSSVFRELMQKYMNQRKGEEESEGEEGNDRFAYLCSSNGKRLPNLQLPGEKALPAQYHRTDEQFVWNGCFQRI